MEQIIVLTVDLGQNLIFIPLLIVKLEILAPSWAISDALVHLTSTFAWEKLVASDQI
jgi:hypothetical protein